MKIEKFNWRKAGRNVAMAAAASAAMGGALQFANSPYRGGQTTSHTQADNSELVGRNLTPKFAVLIDPFSWDSDGNLRIHGKINNMHGADNKTTFDPDKIDLIGYDASQNEYSRVNVTHDSEFELANDGEFYAKLPDFAKKIKYFAFGIRQANELSEPQRADNLKKSEELTNRIVDDLYK